MSGDGTDGRGPSPKSAVSESVRSMTHTQDRLVSDVPRAGRPTMRPPGDWGANRWWAHQPPQRATGSTWVRLRTARGRGAVTSRPRRRITAVTASVDRRLLLAEARVLRAFRNWPGSPFAITEMAGRHGGLLDQSVGTRGRAVIVGWFSKPSRFMACGEPCFDEADPEWRIWEWTSIHVSRAFREAGVRVLVPVSLEPVRGRVARPRTTGSFAEPLD